MNKFSQKRIDIDFRSVPQYCIRKTSFNYDVEYNKISIEFKRDDLKIDYSEKNSKHHIHSISRLFTCLFRIGHFFLNNISYRIAISLILLRNFLFKFIIRYDFQNQNI